MPDAAARQKDQIRKIRNIRGRALVMYGRAEALLTKLADLLDTPKCHRMPGLIIAGDTNNGKTTIVEAFSKKPSRVHYLKESGPLLGSCARSFSFMRAVSGTVITRT